MNVKFKLLLSLVLNLFMMGSLSRADFYSVSDIPKEVSIKNRDTILKSIFRFESNKNLCTGTFISDDGVFLTALHCFEQCFKNYGYAIVQDTIEGSSLYEVDLERIQRGFAFCNIKDQDNKILKATILSSGRGFSDKGYEEKLLALQNPKDVKRLNFKGIHGIRQIGFGPADDYVIAKLDSLQKRTCVSIESNPEISIGDFIWTAGYPSKSIRPQNKGSDGINMQLSIGQVNQTVLQNPCVKYSDQDTALDLQLYRDIPGTFWTTLDSVEGASGSPTFNSKNELTGVIISIQNDKGAKNEYCSGGVSVLKLSNVKKVPGTFCTAPH